MIFFLILRKIRDILITVFVFFEQKMNIIRMIVHNMKQIDFLTKIEEVVFVYESLLEIFYKNRNEYNKICEERLSNDDVTFLPLEVKGKKTFYLLTKEVHNQMLSMYKMNAKVNKILQQLPEVAVDHFCRRCLIDEIVLTNDIEGVVSTRKDIGDILDKVPSENKEKNDKLSGLVDKYRKLQKKEKIPLSTCQDVRELYNELFLNEVILSDSDNQPDGKYFRKDSVEVRTQTQKSIHTGLEPESKIIEAMQIVLDFINDDEYDLLIRTAICHYYIGYIHPFYDGNGRLSRFISSYLITQEFAPVLAYRLSYTIKENIKEYYEAFKTCNDPRNQGDLTPFVLMFLRVLKISMEQLIVGLEKRKGQLEYYETLLGNFAKSEEIKNEDVIKMLFVLVQSELFSERGISTQELLEFLEISRSTLKKIMESIQNYGLIKKMKRGTKNFFGIYLEELEKLVHASSK